MDWRTFQSWQNKLWLFSHFSSHDGHWAETLILLVFYRYCSICEASLTLFFLHMKSTKKYIWTMNKLLLNHKLKNRHPLNYYILLNYNWNHMRIKYHVPFKGKSYQGHTHVAIQSYFFWFTNHCFQNKYSVHPDTQQKWNGMHFWCVQH